MESRIFAVQLRLKVMLNSNNQFPSEALVLEQRSRSSKLFVFGVCLLSLMLIIAGYFVTAKLLSSWPFEKQNELVAADSEEIPTFIYLKHEHARNSGQQKIPVGRYKSNKKATSTMAELYWPVSAFRGVLATSNHSELILATGSELVHLSSDGRSKGGIFNLKKTLNDEGYMFVNSPVFSPDGKKIVYFASVNTTKNQNEQVRIFSIDSGEDKPLIENVAKTPDDLDPYGVGFIYALNPLYWFKDEYGEKILFAQEPQILPTSGVFGRIWMYDFKKNSIFPIKTYDAQGDLLTDCTRDRSCRKLYSALSRSNDGRYLLVSFSDQTYSDSDNSARNLFVLDFSVLANNTENILQGAAISLPSCGQAFTTVYLWSSDDKKILCNEYRILGLGDSGVFTKNLKESYEVQYINYAIDIESKTKDILSQSTKTIVLSKEYINAIDVYMSRPGEPGAENLFFYFLSLVQQQNEKIIGSLPDNRFLVSRPVVSDNARRQLIVSDLHGDEMVIDEITGEFEFLGWIND